MEDVSIAISPSIVDIEAPSQSQLDAPNERSSRKLILRSLVSVVLIAGCFASLQFATSRDFTRGVLKSASALKDELAQNAYTGWSKLPGRKELSIIRNVSWLSTKATAESIKMFTAETAELAWEKAELAWDSIDGVAKKTYDSDLQNNSQENGFVRALGGIGEFLHLGDRKGKQMDRSNVRRQGQQKKEKRGDQAHRRLKAVDSKNDIGKNESATAGSAEAQINWLSSLSESPLALAILVLSGVAFLIASFISSPDSRRLNRLAASYKGGNLVDQEEAEILEFYEKEMEAESFDKVLSFDGFDVEDGYARLDNSGDHEENQAVGSRPSSLPDGSMQLLKRENGDSYYARVLQDIEALDSEDVTEREQNGPVEKLIFEARHEDEPKESSFDQNECESFNTPNERLDASQEQNEDDLNESTSSISSLTSDNYSDDIESSISYSFESEADETEASFISALAKSELQQMLLSPVPTQPLRTTSLSDAEGTPSESTDTPIIQNTSYERLSSLAKQQKPPQLKRRVSFNPEVTVKEIPRRQVGAISSEKYLYFMLLIVGIAITFFSLLPAHPSLSPVASMSRQEIIHRADSLLSSQWDVEL
jgi:hypothetical protein